MDQLNAFEAVLDYLEGRAQEVDAGARNAAGARCPADKFLAASYREIAKELVAAKQTVLRFARERELGKSRNAWQRVLPQDTVDNIYEAAGIKRRQHDGLQGPHRTIQGVSSQSLRGAAQGFYNFGVACVSEPLSAEELLDVFTGDAVRFRFETLFTQKPGSKRTSFELRGDIDEFARFVNTLRSRSKSPAADLGSFVAPQTQLPPADPLGVRWTFDATADGSAIAATATADGSATASVSLQPDSLEQLRRIFTLGRDVQKGSAVVCGTLEDPCCPFEKGTKAHQVFHWGRSHQVMVEEMKRVSKEHGLAAQFVAQAKERLQAEQEKSDRLVAVLNSRSALKTVEDTHRYLYGVFEEGKKAFDDGKDIVHYPANSVESMVFTWGWVYGELSRHLSNMSAGLTQPPLRLQIRNGVTFVTQQAKGALDGDYEAWRVIKKL